jgi:MFS transporter, NHS family, xanthosine permease
MDIKLRLKILSFMELFVWGSYLTSLGKYCGATLHFSGPEIGTIFTTLGIGSLIMPPILGIVADKYINAEKVLGICHLFGAGFLVLAASITGANEMFWVMLAVAMCFMPTLALSNSVSYSILKQNNFDVIKVFPPIRVWGTIGFIVAMWIVDLLQWTMSKNQLYVGAISGVVMAIISFTMPKCPTSKSSENTSLFSRFGLDAFVLFKQRKMAVFFIFAMFLGAALQITNMEGQDFLGDFGKIDEYKNSFGVNHTGILMSISQISETLFILAIPFFLYKFGIKKVMLISMIAWVLRFGFFAIGNPGGGLFLLILSMIIYGMAFDFFNISGSLFVEKETNPNIRSSAQGLFMMMTNGLGAIIGAKGCGYVVGYFTENGEKNWQNIWFTFAAYALVLAILFPLIFKYEHKPEKLENISH